MISRMYCRIHMTGRVIDLDVGFEMYDTILISRYFGLFLNIHILKMKEVLFAGLGSKRKQMTSKFQWMHFLKIIGDW